MSNLTIKAITSSAKAVISSIRANYRMHRILAQQVSIMKRVELLLEIEKQDNFQKTAALAASVESEIFNFLCNIRSSAPDVARDIQRVHAWVYGVLSKNAKNQHSFNLWLKASGHC